MNDNEKKLLESFKPGKYAQLTILVDTKDLVTFVNHLKLSGLKLAVMPHVKAEVDFQDDDSGSTT